MMHEAESVRGSWERLRAAYQDSEQWTAVHEAWDAKGPETKKTLVDLLPGDWSFEGKRVLDFGCGMGRTLRHFLAEGESAEFWGADIDAESIAVVQNGLCPPMQAMVCDVSPPLGLEYGSFDLIWAISVFTHLTDNSVPWLLELHRLLKPGALLIATYMGRWNSEYAAGETWNEDLVGMNTVHHTVPWDRGGPSVLISDWWLRAHWGRAFEILEVVPNVHNMSWALCRKRDVELTPEDVERPENDPREYLAVRHNLEHVQRELEFNEAVCAKLIADVRREYEQSLSWRVTRPLRHAARNVKSRARK